MHYGEFLVDKSAMDLILRVLDYIVTVSFGYILYCVCFHFYCGYFKLFCNVWVCLCGFCNVWVVDVWVYNVWVCMCGFCNVWVYVCVGFVMCGCVCVGFVMCGCVCVGVYVWVL